MIHKFRSTFLIRVHCCKYNSPSLIERTCTYAFSHLIFFFTSGIGVLGLNAAKKAKVVLCSDSNEYVDEVFDKCADTLPEVRNILCDVVSCCVELCNLALFDMMWCSFV